MERLTCLVIRPGGDPLLVVPRLELPAAQASPAGGLGLEMIGWDETDDPYALVASGLGSPAAVGLADRMLALSALRSRKSAAEVAALREAGQAIDRVHALVPGWLRSGRTERQVAADIADSILAE